MKLVTKYKLAAKKKLHQIFPKNASSINQQLRVLHMMYIKFEMKDGRQWMKSETKLRCQKASQKVPKILNAMKSILVFMTFLWM